LERRLERFTLSSAAGLVTVSEPLAEVLRGRHHRPTITVTNGFDPADYPETSHPATDGITLLYTGQLFSRQDPSPLIRALALLDASERQQVIVRFVGKFLAMQLAGPLALAESLGVRDRIELLPPVPYRDSLRMQRDADVLVQFSWNDPSQTGVLSGKLFEYIGARRPILLVGATHSLATTLVRERALGVSVENPDAIAVQLRAWLIEKSATGRLPDLPASAGAGLTREDQTRVLEAFLVRLTS
jgi:glycosyltransferase involved in cell wall biosynthesis